MIFYRKQVLIGEMSGQSCCEPHCTTMHVPRQLPLLPSTAIKSGKSMASGCFRASNLKRVFLAFVFGFHLGLGEHTHRSVVWIVDIGP
jgi:hypothetical protein